MGKKKAEPHANHERWLISYADFITLLFAFFVVMYAVSSVNEGKYRVLSDTLHSSFKAPPQSIEPVQIGKVPASKTKHEVPWLENPFPGEALYEPFSVLTRVGQEIEQNFKSLIDEHMVSVRKNKDWLELEIKSSVLFVMGSARLMPEMTSLVEKLAIFLTQYPFYVTVEGYTDTIPISNDMYPSNWDLSVARAAAIVRLLEHAGLPSDKIAPIGYGDNFPVASNTTPEGRAKNRRVVFLVQRDNKRHRELKEQEYSTILEKLAIPGEEKTEP